MLSTRWSTRLVSARTWQDVRSCPLRLSTARYASLKTKYKRDGAAGSAQRNTDSSGGDASKTADSSTDGSKQDRSIFSHSSGGPLGGIVDKTKELRRRFRDTPGATSNERLSRWYQQRSSEYAADTGVTWPSARATKLWKFFFKANRGTTDRYGFAIKMGPMDQRSEAERAAARERSAASLVNIDPQERTRRTTLGATLVLGSAAAAVVLIGGDMFPDHDSMLRTVTKAGLFGPFAFGMLQLGSGVLGL